MLESDPSANFGGRTEGQELPCRLRRPSPSTEGDKCGVVTAGSDVSFIEEIGAARRYSRQRSVIGTGTPITNLSFQLSHSFPKTMCRLLEAVVRRLAASECALASIAPESLDCFRHPLRLTWLWPCLSTFSEEPPFDPTTIPCASSAQAESRRDPAMRPRELQTSSGAI